MDETNITVKADNHVITMKNQFNFKKDDEVKLVLRPEAAHLTDSGDIKVEVILSTFMGSYQLYHVKQGNNVVKITEYNPRNQRIFQVGETAYLSFDDADVHPLPSHEPIKVETIYRWETSAILFLINMVVCKKISIVQLKYERNKHQENKERQRKNSLELIKGKKREEKMLIFLEPA